MDKEQQFQQSLRKGPALVFCARCGSTRIDQATLDRLVCCDCRNSIVWDGLSFGIAEIGGIDEEAVARLRVEARRAFNRRQSVPPWISAAEAAGEELDVEGTQLCLQLFGEK